MGGSGRPPYPPTLGSAPGPPGRSSTARSFTASAAAVLILLLGGAGPPAWAADAGPVHAVIVGRSGDPATAKLLEAAATAGRTDLVVTFYDVAAPRPPDVPSSVRRFLADARSQGVAVAYVCTETLCSLPVVDPPLLRQTIREFAQR